MICVSGAGAFGTALAISLAKVGPVMLWSHDADHATQMQEARENPRRLPGVALPDAITVTSDLGSIPAEIPILLAVPMQRLRAMAGAHSAHLSGRPLVACCKGVELSTGKGPIAILQEVVPDATAAILTGPSFAADIARGLPTALTLACADEAVGTDLQQALTTPNLRIYRTTDTIGAELGGALKNVIAIGCGVCIGRGLGDSARAALMTRGFAEMRRLATDMGAHPDTLLGLSGLGDLSLTCTSDLSRNYRYGLALGTSDTFDSGTTVEGVATARAVSDLAQTRGLDMPISNAIAGLCEGKYTVEEAIQALLNRPLKEE